jgi:hypothetical protein
VEGFEHLVKVALETEDLIVAGNLKFYVQRRTKKLTIELQTHGYEVDLVGARRDKLVLASVKSWFGSKGVNCQGFKGISGVTGGYILWAKKPIEDGLAKIAESSTH